MKNTLKIAPLLVLALAVISCGPSGGAAGTPEEIGDAVKDAIVGISFTDVYSYLPAHRIESDKQANDAKAWRWEEGYERWKDVEEYIKELDPERESGMTDEDGFKNASHAERYALMQGLYKLHDIEKKDERLGDGLWFRASRSVELNVEGQGSATVTYSNKYGDSIRVRCVREDGLWALSRLEVSIPKEAPKKPESE